RTLAPLRFRERACRKTEALRLRPTEPSLVEVRSPLRLKSSASLQPRLHERALAARRKNRALRPSAELLVQKALGAASRSLPTKLQRSARPPKRSAELSRRLAASSAARKKTIRNTDRRPAGSTLRSSTHVERSLVYLSSLKRSSWRSHAMKSAKLLLIGV